MNCPGCVLRHTGAWIPTVPGQTVFLFKLYHLLVEKSEIMPLKASLHCLPHSSYCYILIPVVYCYFISYSNWQLNQLLKLRAYGSIRREESHLEAVTYAFETLWYIPCWLFSAHACFPDCFQQRKAFRKPQEDVCLVHGEAMTSCPILCGFLQGFGILIGSYRR